MHQDYEREKNNGEYANRAMWGQNVVSNGAPAGAPLSSNYGMPTEASTGGTSVMPSGAPAGAPAERTDAPIPDKLVATPRRVPAYAYDSAATQRANEWSEPVYSQTHETMSNMYTPGIYVDQPYSRKREVGAQEGKKQTRTGRFGRVMRAVCLILVCALLSGAASYGVMEYRFNRGDFTIINQYTLGGSPGSQQNNSLSAPAASSGKVMSAEDIYTMACTQVVSITTKYDSMGGMFSDAQYSSSNAVEGSGFIISSDGFILTNYHVVETAFNNSLPLIVSRNDGTEYEAKVIGYDRNNDVALVKIAAEGLNPVVIANSDSINVGQTVYAVGNPLGELVYTMTEGIVSARDREVSVEGKTINTFQFSAAVNSGNSGGPLYDANGEVIGIVTAKPMRSSVEGIGFAIPINDAFGIAAELIEYGYITGRPLLGITIQTVTSAHAEYWSWVVGARIRSVTEGSAAERAGLMPADIIIKLGETEIDSQEVMVFSLRKYRAGDSEKITVWRDGEELELTITFDEDLSAGQAVPPQAPAQEGETLPEGRIIIPAPNP